MEAEIIRILKVIMNNKVGLEVVTQTKGGIKKIALCLGSTQLDKKNREAVLDLLTVACMEQYVPGGHQYVVSLPRANGGGASSQVIFTLHFSLDSRSHLRRSIYNGYLSLTTVVVLVLISFHRLVVDALNYFQHVNRERVRFLTLTENLKATPSVELKVRRYRSMRSIDPNSFFAD